VISRYTDHAANERTYLAWIRTAIAIMGFGFVIERFDLFMIEWHRINSGQAAIGPSSFAQMTGLVLLLVGIGIVVAATLRFRSNAKAIEADDLKSYQAAATSLSLSLLLAAVGSFLIIYLLYRLMA